MKESDMNDNLKPLLDIENDLTEMSKITKIIASMKSDIEEKIKQNKEIKNNNINNNDMAFIEDKYNKIKKQIQKFMDKKKYIYNFIRNEYIQSKTKTNNNNIMEEENEILLEEKTEYTMENAMQNINKMQNEIKNKIKILDEKLAEINFVEKKEPLIEEINKNDINIIDINSNNNEMQKLKKLEKPLLHTKAYIYNEQTKELEKVSNTIEIIRKGTNDMKYFLKNQGNTIDYLNDESHKIENNIEKGINELSKTKEKNRSNNKTYILSIGCLLLLIIIVVYAIYRKFSK